MYRAYSNYTVIYRFNYRVVCIAAVAHPGPNPHADSKSTNKIQVNRGKKAIYILKRPGTQIAVV